MNQEIMQALLEWNPWLEGVFPDRLIGYRREFDIISYLKIEEIKILIGSRRVGKSTLLYKVIKEGIDNHKSILYINFQDEILSKYTLSEIYYCFIEKYKVDYLMLDEVQDCTDWVYFVRKLYDNKNLEQIWITGSNSRLIKKEYSELLTGRNLTLKIFPLSFEEILTFHQMEGITLPMSLERQSKVKHYFSEYFKYGSFPAVVLKDVYKTELLQNYFEDIIYKDIASRYDVNVKKIKDLGVYLASNISKSFSYRKVANSLGIHPNTLAEYMSHFEETYLFDVVHKFDYSLQKQMAYEKKVYMVDCGLAQSISFGFSQDQGRVLENLVYNELKRRLLEIYFYKGDRECDFIIKQGLQVTAAYQVSVSLSNEKTREREIEGLQEAMKTHNLKAGTILTLDDEENLEDLHIQILPIWKWSLQK